MKKTQGKCKVLVKGFSLVEILVTVGIIGVLASIAGLSYLNYLDKGHLSSLEQSIRGFWKAVDICLIVKDDDINKCNTLEKLKFTCENCSAVTMPTLSWAEQNRVIWSVKSGQFSACTRYTPKHLTVSKRKKVTINHPAKKFCHYHLFTAAKRDMTDGSIPDPTDTSDIYSARFPFEICKAASDCRNSSDKCESPTSAGAVGSLGCPGLAL